MHAYGIYIFYCVHMGNLYVPGPTTQLGVTVNQTGSRGAGLVMAHLVGSLIHINCSVLSSLSLLCFYCVFCAAFVLENIQTLIVLKHSVHFYEALHDVELFS